VGRAAIHGELLMLGFDVSERTIPADETSAEIRASQTLVPFFGSSEAIRRWLFTVPTVSSAFYASS